MARRLSRIRRAAFLVALVVSAAVYAYSVAGIMGTGSELRSVVSAQSVERSAPVNYRSATDRNQDCPYSTGASRVEL
jgi:hypothetical protein